MTTELRVEQARVSSAIASPYFWAAFAVAMLIVVSAVAFRIFSDEVERQYATVAESRSGEHPTNALPDWMPNECDEVQVRWNFDTNWVWARVHCSAPLLKRIEERLAPMGLDEVRQEVGRHEGPKWWRLPRLLRDQSLELRCYSGTRVTEYGDIRKWKLKARETVVVNRSNGFVYYYCDM